MMDLDGSGLAAKSEDLTLAPPQGFHKRPARDCRGDD
jgi:hypothetical protein